MSVLWRDFGLVPVADVLRSLFQGGLDRKQLNPSGTTS